MEFLFLFLFTTNAYSQANSDYLKSLEGEASELSLDNETREDQQKDSLSKRVKTFGLDLKDQKGGAALSEFVPGLSLQQFELVLKNNYMGSYLFYKRLSADNKEQVYGFYENNPDLQKVRDKILQINKK